MFAENKYTTHFAMHKNAQSITVQCSLSNCQPEKSKGLAYLTTVIIRTRFLLHFVITSSHSIRSLA